jgi:hypothetical protein
VTGAHRVTPRVSPWKCLATHPTDRFQCVAGNYGHDLHWNEDPGRLWNTATGRTGTSVGSVFVTYFARFVPLPGHEADSVVEHFPDQLILLYELTRRITHRYGTSFAPEDSGRTVRYSQVDPGAYMDVWVIVSSDHRVYDPVPDPCTSRPVERWYLVGEPRGDVETVRSEYLPVVTPVSWRTP